MRSCAFLWFHQDISLLHPPMVHWNVHICFRCLSKRMVIECSTFSQSEQEQSISQTRGGLPEQVMKWFLWGGHCLRGAQMVGVPSCEPPTLTPPVSLQHSLSGHLDGVCELFESEACLCEHLLFQPNLLSVNFSGFFFFLGEAQVCDIFLQNSHCSNLW